MSTISLHKVSLQFPGQSKPLFDDLSLKIDTRWRCGLVGRNGRGKSSLLRLLTLAILPDRGTVALQERAVLCARPDPSLRSTTREVIRDVVAPFTRWEQEMADLLAEGSPPSLNRYGNIMQEYEHHGGYEIANRIERECDSLNVDPHCLDRPFSSLSGGEQTRAMIASIFLMRDAYPLLDEPTDHLDLEGRAVLARYLRLQSGFLLASHDRDLLDECTDHIIAIHRSGVDIHKGNYSTWHAQMLLKEEHERKTAEKIERQVTILKQSAKDRRQWSNARESTKTGGMDSGFEGARAARQMKRAIAIERRINKELGEKEKLLRNRETIYRLRVKENGKLPEFVLRADQVTMQFGERVVFEDLSLEVRRGDRIALTGPNGCGKTTMFRLLCGELAPVAGAVHRPPHLSLGISHQHPRWTRGLLRGHLLDAKLDETQFRTILGALGVGGEVFDQPLESFSYGQRKKVDLARALSTPADAHLWDEPTNAIDLYAREELERAVLRERPTLLFIDHDSAFVRNIATRILRFVETSGRWGLVEAH